MPGREDRTLRHFLRNTAPPMIRPRLRQEPGLVDVSYHQPATIIPGPGDAPLDGDPGFPGNDIPSRVQDREPPLSSGWARLARGGQAIGKTENFRYDAAAAEGKGIEVLRVAGSDLDAIQLRVTLTQPAIAMLDLADLDEQAQFASNGAQDIQAFATSGDVDPAQVFPGTGTPPAWAPITAWIQWGTGGAQLQAYVDWVQGATILVTGSYVSVVPVQLPDALNRPGQSALYRVGANVGPGEGGRGGGSATRTMFTEALDDEAESVAYPIPPFAKRVTVLGFDDGDPVIANGYLRFWQRSTPARNLGSPFFNANQPVAFNVPNAATYFTVRNGSGSTLGFSVIWELDL